MELLDVGEKGKKSVEYHNNELNVLHRKYKGNKAFSFKHHKMNLFSMTSINWHFVIKK